MIVLGEVNLTTLQQHGAPEIHPTAADRTDHLVQMPTRRAE